MYTKHWVLLTAGFVALAGLEACERPNIDDLFARVSTLEAGGDDALSAVKELGAQSGDRVDEMILRIIAGDTELVSPPVQEEAIRSAVTRNIAGAGRVVARKLVPHGAITTRQAAASALLDVDCDDICMEAVLYSAEASWLGRENLEDWQGAKVSDRTQALMHTKQLELAATLDQVILRHPAEALAVLDSRYGIASPIPSPFALRLIAKLKFGPACGALLGSLRTFELASKDVPDDLARAMTAAGCLDL